jgi:hypothetical protein
VIFKKENVKKNIATKVNSFREDLDVKTGCGGVQKRKKITNKKG